MDEALANSYELCKATNKAHGKTYYWATNALPKPSRKHVHAIYAFCRHADDLVDCLPQEQTQLRRDKLNELGERFFDDLRAGQSVHPLLGAVVASAIELELDAALFERFLRSMSMDLDKASYETFDELMDYMDGSAAVIGEMMLPVLAPDVHETQTLNQLRHGARSLGIAFQLTNFLRDVGEDLTRGRVYIPQDTLTAFGADPRRRSADANWVRAMQHEIERTRSFYCEADETIGLLPPNTRRCVQIARRLYSDILGEIEANQYDVFSTRARVSTPKKAATSLLLAARR